MNRWLLIPAFVVSGFALTLATAAWRGQFQPFAAQTSQTKQAPPATHPIAWNAVQATTAAVPTTVAAPTRLAAEHTHPSAPAPAPSSDSSDAASGSTQTDLPLDTDSHRDARDRDAQHGSRSR